MRHARFHPFVLVFTVLSVSCVSTSQYKAVQRQAQEKDSLYSQSMRTLKTCQETNDNLNKQKMALQNDIKGMDLMLSSSKENNTLLRKQLQDLSSLSSAQAESLKRSLDNMGAKDQYFQDLQTAIGRRDSANLTVVMKLKAALNGLGERDAAINMEKGGVCLDLADRLLFEPDSNSYVITDKGKTLLGKLAGVLNDQPGMNIMVEGHTDSLAYPQPVLLDNWDLSVKRATSVVRILQKDYSVSPLRMTAAGQGEYQAIAPNDNPVGQSANRRTRIVFLSQINYVQQALEHRQG